MSESPTGSPGNRLARCLKRLSRVFSGDLLLQRARKPKNENASLVPQRSQSCNNLAGAPGALGCSQEEEEAQKQPSKRSRRHSDSTFWDPCLVTYVPVRKGALEQLPEPEPSQSTAAAAAAATLAGSRNQQQPRSSSSTSFATSQAFLNSVVDMQPAARPPVKLRPAAVARGAAPAFPAEVVLGPVTPNYCSNHHHSATSSWMDVLLQPGESDAAAAAAAAAAPQQPLGASQQLLYEAAADHNNLVEAPDCRPGLCDTTTAWLPHMQWVQHMLLATTAPQQLAGAAPAAAADGSSRFGCGARLADLGDELDSLALLPLINPYAAKQQQQLPQHSAADGAAIASATASALGCADSGRESLTSLGACVVDWGKDTVQFL